MIGSNFAADNTTIAETSQGTLGCCCYCVVFCASVDIIVCVVGSVLICELIIMLKTLLRFDVCSLDDSDVDVDFC